MQTREEHLAYLRSLQETISQRPLTADEFDAAAVAFTALGQADKAAQARAKAQALRPTAQPPTPAPARPQPPARAEAPSPWAPPELAQPPAPRREQRAPTGPRPRWGAWAALVVTTLVVGPLLGALDLWLVSQMGAFSLRLISFGCAALAGALVATVGNLLDLEDAGVIAGAAAGVLKYVTFIALLMALVDDVEFNAVFIFNALVSGGVAFWAGSKLLGRDDDD